MAYYGTSPQGHLEPPAFECVRCGRALTMDECVLLPAEGVVDEETAPEVMPWFDPRRRWTFGGWFTMLLRSMCEPRRYIRSIPPERSSGFLFALVILCAGFAIGGASWTGLMMVGQGAFITTGSVLDMVWRSLVVVICWAAASALLLLLWCLVAHGLLRMTGSVARGLHRTTQCLCFGAPMSLAMALPCVGCYTIPVIPVWWCIVAATMVAEAQRVSGARAALAVLAFPLVSIGSCCGFPMVAVALLGP